MFNKGKHQSTKSIALNFLTNKKLSFALLVIAIVAILCVTLFTISVSFAETDNKTLAAPEGQIDVADPINPEEQVEPMDVVDPEKKVVEAVVEEPANIEDVQDSNEINAPELQIFKSDGTTQAEEGQDYEYADSIISVKADSLIIVGDPNVPVTDVIKVNEQPGVHNLTLRNVNMNNTRDLAGIEITESSQNASFYLNIEGTCTYTASVGQHAFVNFYTNWEFPKTTFNHLYIKGSNNSNLYAYLSGQTSLFTDFRDEARLPTATHFCGDLNIHVPNSNSSESCFFINNSIDSLYFEDNVMVDALNTICFYGIIDSRGNVIAKDNAYLNIQSVDGSAVEIGLDFWDQDNYPHFSLEDNASACFKSSNNTLGTILCSNSDVIINTTGTLSCFNDNNWVPLELSHQASSDPPCKVEVEKGTVYLSGVDSGHSKGSVYIEGNNFVMPEGASFKGAPNINSGEAELVYDVFLAEVDPVEDQGFYSAYINTESNVRVPAGTVQISYPPAPYPTPEEYVTAQTGDDMGAVASLCMVVITASAGYVLLRILHKKEWGDC